MTPAIGSHRTVMAYEMPVGEGIHRISSNSRLGYPFQSLVKADGRVR